MVQCGSKPVEKVSNVDDVLDQFGVFGRYHVRLMVLVALAFLSNTAYCANYVFAAKSVTYWCKEPYENVTHCAVISNSTACTEWEYEDPNSFVAEFGLACQEWKRTLVGTTHSFGYMLGLLIVGPMSDRIGRKRAIVITGVMGGVFGLARSFSAWYWFYIAMEFFEAVIGDICSPMYVLQLELVSAKNKVRFNMFCGIGFVFGGVVLAVVAWLVPYWRALLRVIYIPAFLFLLYKYFLDESPRWLLMRGNKEKAVKILEKAAKENNVTLDRNTLENLCGETKENVKFLNVLAETFKSGTLRLRFLVCLTWWTTCTFVNYGLVINSVSLQGNKYMNFALTSLVELPSLFVVSYILHNFNRKLPLIGSFFVGGLLCVAQPFMPLHLPWLSIAVYMIGKLVSSCYFGITYMFTLELFPTYTRNSMHALCSSLGRIGSILAPQTPLLLPIWFGLPSLVFGLCALVAALLTFLVPDIANDALPDTVREAEALGKLKSLKAQGRDNEGHDNSEL